MKRPASAFAGMLIALGGCAAGAPLRTFVLTAPADAENSGAPDGSPPAVQLQAVILPDYLDTEEILVRSGRYELEASTTGRWGERLSAGVAHSLTAALALELPEYRFEAARPRDDAARQVLVNVEAFDVWRDGHCALSASWTILERHTGAVITSGHGVFTIPLEGATAPAGDATVVAAMAQGVNELARALALALRVPSPPAVAAGSPFTPTGPIHP